MYHQNAVEGRVCELGKITKQIKEEYISNLFCEFKRAANLIKYHQDIYGIF